MSRPRGYSDEEFRNSRLINAAGNGDVAAVLRELKAAPPPTEQDCAMGMYRAALYGHIDAVRLLISSGADCNAVTDTHGRTPLFAAASSRFPAITAALLEAGADIGVVNKEGWSALHVAASYGNAENVGLFLEHGARADITDNTQDTPLTMSCRHGHVDVIRELLKAGVDVNGERGGTSALKVAAGFGHAFVVKELLEVPNVEVEKRDANGETPFITAARAHSSEVLRLLSMHGADVNAQSKAGYSALHLAVANGNLAMTRELLRVGCNQDLQARDGRRPADCALEGKHGAAALAEMRRFKDVCYPRMCLLIIAGRMERGEAAGSVGDCAGSTMHARLGDLDALNSDVLRHMATCLR